jgi:hypothetical protein
VAKETRQIKTCFVAAPGGIALDTLRDSLLAHNIRPLIPQELFAGSDWASEIQRQLLEADLVVGILPRGKQSPWVLFELGQAWALGRRILLIASPKADAVPYNLQRFLILRTEPDNREAIDFALDQLLSSPADSPRISERKSFQSVGMGPDADVFLARLDQALIAKDYRGFESLLADAIKRSGAEVVVESPEREQRADLAVWSDVLEPFVGNPLIIETKHVISEKKSASAIFHQLSSFLGASASRWALLIYGQGPEPENRFWAKCPPNVLILPARDLLEAMRDRGFPEVVRDLRNRRVHSVRP